MSWADIVPNLLIGLREGLEAGLVVSILLAAVNKLAPELEPSESGEASSVIGRHPTVPIWIGVAGAVALSLSFAAVLTYSTDSVSSSTQEAIGGSLSVVAVVLVTAMIFWMRRTAARLSGELRSEVRRALAVGAGALALTAFLSVGREGLETTLFMWTALKASGQTAAPLLGAGIGLLIAIVGCILLYRSALKINLGSFFNKTAVALIVIAAGVLAYGLGDLQDAGIIPGQHWIAFDISKTIDSGSWWVTLISGITDLSTRMTVLQVVAWAVYLVVVLGLFLAAGRRSVVLVAATPAEPSRLRLAIDRALARRPWTVGGALVVTPVVVAGALVAVLPTADAASTNLSVTSSSCAPEWSSGHTGNQVFEIDNKTSHIGEINLDDSSGNVVGEIETLGPATTATLTADLAQGSYHFRCIMSGSATTQSGAVTVSGSGGQKVVAIKAVTLAELTGPNKQYETYAAGVMARLDADVRSLGSALAAGNLSEARQRWLTAQLEWERVGASYDSFGDLGEEVDGLPDGFQDGVRAAGFVGLHRIEYGLWHGQKLPSLVPVAAKLSKAVVTVRKHLSSDDLAGDPTNLPIRAHEIIEDALRDHLSMIDDLGAGAAYPMTLADLQVDRVVIGQLAGLIEARVPGLVKTITSEQNQLQAALQATRQGSRWMTPQSAPTLVRERVEGSIGALLETLAQVPDLLEVPPSN